MTARAGPLRPLLVWGALALALALPLAVAATSPLLQYRQPAYVAAGLAGVVGLGLMLVQPLLAAALMPGLAPARSRRAHVALGAALVVSVAVHVGGLWITSPPDVVDVLLLRSPTPFSVWGLLALVAVGGAAALAALRRRVRPRLWRPLHTALAVLAVLGTVLHALLIEGTMGPATKGALCLLVLAATAGVVARRRAWAGLTARRQARDGG